MLETTQGTYYKMTKEEIYEHLAQVYLGKKSQDKKDFTKNFHFPRIPKEAKVFVTVLALALAFYTLTAFLSRRDEGLKANILYALNNSPIRVQYDLNEPFPQVKDFSIVIAKTDIEKYQSLSFSIRGLEEGYPDIVKVMLKTKKNEVSFQYIDGVNLKWKQHTLALKDFVGITDWSSLSEVAFVLEAWNVKKKKGSILIDDICFSK
jgi:hypothetical protein